MVSAAIIRGYAIHVRPGKELTIHDIPLNGLIYIGEADRIDRRGPLQDKYSGSCSFRRTLGALLKEQLNLRAVPSGTGNTNRDCINYCFAQEDEMKLTNWIQENLEVSPFPLGNTWGRPRDRISKREAIRETRPALCLTAWSNPYMKELQALRKVCADEARAANAARPHHSEEARTRYGVRAPRAW